MNISYLLFILLFIFVISLTIFIFFLIQTISQQQQHTEQFVNWKKLGKSIKKNVVKVGNKTGITKVVKQVESNTVKIANKTGITNAVKQVEKYGKTGIHELSKAKNVNWKLLATSPLHVVHPNTGCATKNCVKLPTTIHTPYGRLLMCVKTDKHLHQYTNKTLHIEIDQIKILPKMVTIHPQGKITIQFFIPSLFQKHQLTCIPHLNKHTVFLRIPHNQQFLKMFWNQHMIFIRKDGKQHTSIVRHQLSPYEYNYLATIEFTCADISSLTHIIDTIKQKKSVYLNKASNMKNHPEPISLPRLTAETALHNFELQS